MYLEIYILRQTKWNIILKLKRFVYVAELSAIAIALWDIKSSIAYIAIFHQR